MKINIMKINMGRFTANSLNPVIGLANSGTVLYSNIAGEPLLHKWNVRVGEKVPSYIEDFVQNAISQKSPTKMEVEVENKVYLVTFHPTPDKEKETFMDSI